MHAEAKNNGRMKVCLMWANHDVTLGWDKRNADDALTGKNTSLVCCSPTAMQPAMSFSYYAFRLRDVNGCVFGVRRPGGFPGRHPHVCTGVDSGMW